VAEFNLASLVIADANKDASEAATIVLDMVIRDASANRFAMLTAGSVQGGTWLSETLNEFDGTTYTATELSASGFPIKYSLAGAQVADQRAVMLLSRQGGTLVIGAAMFDAATSSYDIRGYLVMGNNEVAVDFNQFALFVSMIAANIGGVYTYPSAAVSLTQGLPSYSVTGTKYEAGGGTQLAWNTAFSVTPHRPSGTLVTQAVFPSDARLGELLRATVDSNYTAPYPVAPYNKTVLDQALVVVTNTSVGQQSFERVVLGTEFDALAEQISTFIKYHDQ
jgi:hypothetical protein